MRLAILALWGAVLAFSVGAISPEAIAREEITRYDSDILVQPDGTLRIEEVITANVERRNIQRGIFRDFPTSYRDNQGNAVTVGFNVVSVRRGGDPEPYSVVPHQNGMRVRIGNPDCLLSRGEHTYRLTYETTWQITHLETTDELYFNAIGHGWRFPILAGSVTVTLPDGAEVGRATSYAGRQGRNDWVIAPERMGANQLRYTLDSGLAAYEGLTVLLEWQAGLVARPSGADKAERFLVDNGWVGIGAASVFLTFMYLYGAWKLVGRDPGREAVIVQYEPPEGPYGPMSPAFCRFIEKTKTDHTNFTAAIVALAAKGVLEITETGRTVSLTRVAEAVDLPPGEQVLIDRLAPKIGDRYRFSSKFDKKLAMTLKLFSQAVSRGENRFFSSNSRPVHTGTALGVAGLCAMVLGGVNLIWGLGSLLILGGVGYWGLSSLRNESATTDTSFVPLVAMLCFFAGIFAVTSTDAATHIRPVMGVFLVAVVLCAALFSYLMKARTPYGQRLLEKVEGLKLYMSVAEKDRLDFHNPPEKTPAHFEALLPYAIALGVENRWGDQFDDVLEKAAKARGEEDYHPSWYRGSRRFSRRRGGFSAGAFSGALAASVNSSIASAATPPASSGSSGFSGGGGSSGGGGGGGGGGGW